MESNIQKKNSKYIIFILLIYMLVFQDFIQRHVPIFQYFDEFLAVLIIPVLILKLKNTESWKIKKNDLIIIVLLSLIVIIGIYANIRFKYQSFRFVLADMLVFLKFFMAYFLSELLLDKEFIDDIKTKLSNHIKFLIYFLFVCTILNYIFKIWPFTGERFGISSNKLFYGQPTALAAVGIFLLALLELVRKNEKKHILPTICISIVISSTLRIKALAAVCLAIALTIYIHKKQKKITLLSIVILAGIAILLAHDQIYYYFFEIDRSARQQLLLKSIEIMKRFFPIGAGFATFGSHFSAVSYSPLYYEYNLYSVYGLSPDSPEFASDSFWPMIFGQFGVLGTICYVYCIILLFKNIQGIFSEENINIYTAKLICLVYLLISSTSESAFVNPMSIPLALIIGIKVSTPKHEEEENKKINYKSGRQKKL